MTHLLPPVRTAATGSVEGAAPNDLPVAPGDQVCAGRRVDGVDAAAVAVTAAIRAVNDLQGHRRRQRDRWIDLLYRGTCERTYEELGFTSLPESLAW